MRRETRDETRMTRDVRRLDNHTSHPRAIFSNIHIKSKQTIKPNKSVISVMGIGNHEMHERHERN